MQLQLPTNYAALSTICIHSLDLITSTYDRLTLIKVLYIVTYITHTVHSSYPVIYSCYLVIYSITDQIRYFICRK